MKGPNQVPMTSSTARKRITLTNVQAAEKGREGMDRCYLRLTLLLCCVLASSAAASETPQPAEDAARNESASPSPKPEPETVVTDTASGTDDDPVGSYRQPHVT